LIHLYIYLVRELQGCLLEICMLVQPPSSAGYNITAEKLLSAPASNGAVFRMIRSGNDRIAGSMPSWGPPVTAQEEISQALAASTTRLAPETNMALSLAASEADAKPDDSFGFFDLVDMINPLQHIPIIGTIYRALTGDEIKPAAQIVGGALFGGPIGAAGGAVNAIVQSQTGKDIGGNALAMFTGSGSGSGSGSSSSRSHPDTTLAMASLSYKRPHYNE